jgi:hypothetical protein
MSTAKSLDYQINRLGFWSAIAALVVGVLSMFLPLDAPGGYAAQHADRVAWLSANGETFIAAWVIQIVALVTLTGVFFALAWRVSSEHPLRAIVAAMVVLVSFVVFIIPKFIAVWTIPLLANATSNGSAGADVADQLLGLLIVSIPFSLFTSFDFLGFWLYAVFGLLVARPLFAKSMSAKFAAGALGAYGILFHGMIIAVFARAIAPEDIGEYAMSIAGLLFFVLVAMAIHFKGAMSSRA